MRKLILAAAMALSASSAAAGGIEVGKVLPIRHTVLCDEGHVATILEKMENDFVSGVFHFQQLARTPNGTAMKDGRNVPVCSLVKDYVEFAILHIGSRKYGIKTPSGKETKHTIVKVGYRDASGKIRKGEIFVESKNISDPGLGT